MSGGTENTDWKKLTVVQLKGALARRALNSDGTKEELAKRLQEYEVNANKEKAEMEVEEETPDIEPMLLEIDRNEGRRLIKGLRTVIVNPFKPELMQNPGFVSWIAETASYSIKKNSAGVSAAELVYPTTEKGDVALADLRSIVGETIDVHHPKWERFEDDLMQCHLDLLLDDMDKPKELIGNRLMVLENLPASLNTEEKLDEFFPEAFQAFSYQFDKMSQGIAILEFSTEKDLLEYKQSVGEKITLEGQEVKVTKYTTRRNFWNSIKKNIKTEKTEEALVQTDEGRVALNNELNQIIEQLDGMEQSDELVGYEKIAKMVKLRHRQKTLFHLLKLDTKRRLAAEELTMPEPEDEMQELIKSTIIRTKGEVPVFNDKQNKMEQLKKLQLLKEQHEQQAKNITRSMGLMWNSLPKEVREENENMRPQKVESPNQKPMKNGTVRGQVRNGPQNQQSRSNPWKAHLTRAKKQAIAQLSNRGSGQQSYGRRPGNDRNGHSPRGTAGNRGRDGGRQYAEYGAQGRQRNNSQGAPHDDVDRSRNRQRGRGGNQRGRSSNQGGRGGNQSRQHRQGDMTSPRNRDFSQGTRGGNRGRHNSQGDMTSPRGSYDNRNTRTQKRAGSRQNAYDYDEPPQKMNRGGNRQGRSGSYEERRDYGFKPSGDDSSRRNRHDRRSDPYGDRSRGNQGDGGNSFKLIEGITSALTDKMMQLQEMQKATLETQASLLSSKTAYDKGYAATSAAYIAPAAVGSSNLYNQLGSSSYIQPSSSSYVQPSSSSYIQPSSGSYNQPSSYASPYPAASSTQAYGVDTGSQAYGYGNVKSSSGYASSKKIDRYDRSPAAGKRVDKYERRY